VEDASLSEAVITFVGWDTEAALPGRHPERVTNPEIRRRVLEVVATVDEEVSAAQGHWDWTLATGRNIEAQHPDLSSDAIDAILALITYEWR